MQRRQFFKISAGVAFSLSSLPMTAIAAEKSDVRSNVLVLGGGMAGLCAAISAKQSGASKVLLVEKGGFLGGHSILSGSGYWIGGTKIQKKAGIDDSLEIADGIAGDVAPHCTEVNQQVTRENNKNAVDREQHSNADPPFCFLTIKKNGKQNRQCRP